MRVNGLFGWVQYNNVRSGALLLGFVLLMQALAAVVLFLPLSLTDTAHAPGYHWGGYAVRYAPVVAIAAAALFALQMWWHVKTVRRDFKFRFVDNSDEARLCALVEPLAIAAGMPAPYVGVIDSPAMNAFACGVTRNTAAVVFTRGLINGLDDDELSSVIAHELVHIRNGDTRLIAAANAFLRNMTLLDAFSGLKPRRYRHFVIILVLPVFFLIFLGIILTTQLCLRLGFASRQLISSAREFIADAEAVRLTQHPAAMVSALQRIQGNSALPGVPIEQDAMLIDGMARGRLATHPPILDRIQAIAATTGQMALDARPRRDTRARRALRPGGFGRAGLVGQNMAALERAAAIGAAPRGSVLRALRQSGDDRLVLGLRWDIAVAMLATFLAAMAVNHGNIYGGLGEVGSVLEVPVLLASMGEKARACDKAGFQAPRGQAVSPGACDSVLPDSVSRAATSAMNTKRDAWLLSDSEMGLLSLGELDRKPARQSLPNGGFMFNRVDDKLPADLRATDLMPSYALPLHEAWLRLSRGNIAPFLSALQCGVLVHAHVSLVTDRSVTWSITSETVEQVRFTATLTADGPDATRVSLDIEDFEKTVPMVDSRAPDGPSWPVIMRPALKPPLRPFFAEAMSAMLEGRSFATSRVISRPAPGEGPKTTAEICASQRGRLADGTLAVIFRDRTFKR